MQEFDRTVQKFDYSGNVANVINIVNTGKGSSASGNINLKWMRKLRHHTRNNATPKKLSSYEPQVVPQYNMEHPSKLRHL